MTSSSNKVVSSVCCYSTQRTVHVQYIHVTACLLGEVNDRYHSLTKCYGYYSKKYKNTDEIHVHVYQNKMSGS